MSEAFCWLLIWFYLLPYEGMCVPCSEQSTATRPNGSSSLGISCGNSTSYLHLGEFCTRDNAEDQCQPGLTCSCHKCMGCTSSGICLLDLCPYWMY
ncbi:uncharacterized protein DMAD_08052 [Drosophila madeirensis]|uniref:Neuroparsin n=1 Tax=Drosophila madeirensis TaxID=30013 RepID=A0AAU9EWK4_DROMD